MTDVPRRLTSAEQLALLNEIADRWGGAGCSRSFDGETWRFRRDTGELYEVRLPLDSYAAYVVRCPSAQGALPGASASWTVYHDGIHVTDSGVRVDLLGGPE